MIAIQAHKDDICTDSEMPNFVVWSWMRTFLKLSGSNLMLFAYIYSQSFDSSHCVTTSLSNLSEWFGLTRQTLSRNIDKLPYIIKQTSVDHPYGFYGYYFYKIDMDAMLKDLEKGTDEAYQEFLASYKKLLILKFPNDKKSIEDYFKMFSEWHAGLSCKMRNNVKSFITLGNKVSDDTEEYEDVRFDQALQDVKDQLAELSSNLNEFFNSNSVSTSNNVPISTSTGNLDTNKSVNIKATTSVKHKGAKKPSSLGIVAKPQKPKTLSKEEKARIKQEKFNALISELYALNTDFVVTNNITDERVLTSLNDYVREIVEKENNPKGLTGFKYRESLKQLASIISVDEMLYHISSAIIGGYAKFVYDSDKINKSNQMLMEKIRIYETRDKFLNHYPGASEEFIELINRYVDTSILTTNTWSSLAFERRMQELLDKHLTTDQVITVISDTLSSGWKRWNYTGIDYSITNSVDSVVIDIEKKETATDTFFRQHYFYQTPEIKDVLLDYIHKTSHGQKMSCDKWEQEMEYLLLHRHTNDEIIMAVKDAILHDYEHLCTVDFTKDKRMQQTFGTLENAVKMRDRTRRKHCEKERKNNPNDPKFEGMPEDYFEATAKLYVGTPYASTKT